MKISFCSTCHKRLWQLEETLEHNLGYIVKGESEICLLFYNDYDSFLFIKDKFSSDITEGKLRIFNHQEDRVFIDGSRWSCGYVKDLAHKKAVGSVLFNLDADNFIDDTIYSSLLQLEKREFLITLQSEWKPDGRSGRIGIHKSLYGKVRYRDKGRDDDGDFIRQCLKLGMRAKQVPCLITPIDNPR